MDTLDHYAEQLALLYMSQQDLKDKAPEEIAETFSSLILDISGALEKTRLVRYAKQDTNE